MKYVEKNTSREAFAGGIGLAVAGVLAWALNSFAGVDMPDLVVAEVGAIIMYAAHKIEEATQ